MQNKGTLIAADVDEGRLANSAPRLARAGVTNVQRHTLVQVGKDKWLKRRKRAFDRVLVDAPCSGVGAWRRNPDARWLRRTRSVAELLPVQADVLRRASRLVRPGGRLVYATCSLLLEENDEQVASFLSSEDGAEFEVSPPDDFHVPLDGDFLRLTPAQHGCDGFFGAVLRRREGGWTRRAKSK
jgi:16S rRNA (cytosine967-C5)-methyltransferase